ncbi:MAG: Xylose isomerase domain protein barrel [Rubrobacteraceae bacterium]|nr:Xylose isomerase domain protein barrel [Rubrobacteraceae bacterium]
MQRSHIQSDFSRLSLNQVTTRRWSLREAVEGCLQAGVPAIALWRDKVAEVGLAEAAHIVRESRLRVTSLHVGGDFPAASEAERRARIDDSRRAIEEAAELGAEVLSLRAGPAPDRDIDTARAMVVKGIEQLIPDAQERGVKLVVEPLHPMFAADRSVVVTLSQANDILDRLDSPQVGLVVDAYHVWWDPDLYDQIEQAAGRIIGFHIDDWKPNTLPHMSRVMMGDGVIELRRIRTAVDEAGYSGPIEVEIFNETYWNMPGDEVLELMKERYVEHVL